MRRQLLAGALAAMCRVLAATGASAESEAHAGPGTPGSSARFGQTMAFLAQLGQRGYDAPGIGNLADLIDADSLYLKAVAEQYCRS